MSLALNLLGGVATSLSERKSLTFLEEIPTSFEIHSREQTRYFEYRYTRIRIHSHIRSYTMNRGKRAKETRIPGRTMSARIALFTSRRGEIRALRDFQIPGENLRERRAGEFQPGEVASGWLAASRARRAAPTSRFFVLTRSLFSRSWLKRNETTRLASRRQRKIGASRPGESCICFPLCIIFPRGLRTVSPLTTPLTHSSYPAVYLYSPPFV